MSDQNITGGTALAIITALFGIIVYLIRKPQDMWEKRQEDLELRVGQIEQDYQRLKREIWKEFSNIKDLVISILRSDR